MNLWSVSFAHFFSISTFSGQLWYTHFTIAACYTVSQKKYKIVRFLGNISTITISVVERVCIQNPILGYLESAEIWVKGNWNMAFLYFEPNFCHIWWIFKVQQRLQCTPLWQIIKYGKILVKNEEKPYSKCFQSISPWYCGHPKPGFWIPIPPI